MFLTQFDSADKARNAYLFYKGKLGAALVEPDTTISAAEGEGATDAVAPGQMSESDNPLAELNAELPGAAPSGNYTVALVDTGYAGAGAVDSATVLGASAADDNGHGTAMAERILEAHPGARRPWPSASSRRTPAPASSRSRRSAPTAAARCRRSTPPSSTRAPRAPMSSTSRSPHGAAPTTRSSPTPSTRPCARARSWSARPATPEPTPPTRSPAGSRPRSSWAPATTPARASRAPTSAPRSTPTPRPPQPPRPPRP